MDESLKRQGFQGKVAAQDGVPCPSAMTLTWPLEGQAGGGRGWLPTSGPPKGSGLSQVGGQPGRAVVYQL